MVYGPVGRNRIDLSSDHLVRYWIRELGCSEAELRELIRTVGNLARDVRRRLALRRAAGARTPAPGVAQR